MHRKPLQVVADIKISRFLAEKSHFSQTSDSQQLFSAVQGKPALSKLTMLVSPSATLKVDANDAKHVHAIDQIY